MFANHSTPSPILRTRCDRSHSPASSPHRSTTPQPNLTQSSPKLAASDSIVLDAHRQHHLLRLPSLPDLHRHLQSLRPTPAAQTTFSAFAASVGTSYALHRLGGTSIAQLARINTANIFSSTPIFGDIIRAIVASLGLWGAFATSAIVLGVCLTLCTGAHDRQNTLIGWLFSHAALAIALAPAWSALSIATAPILLGAGIGLLGVSGMLSAQLQQASVSWSTLAASLTLGIACGPLASTLVLGAPMSDQLTHAFLTTAIGMVLSGLYHLNQHWSVFKTPSTDFVREFIIEPPSHLRLDLPGVPAPTVFGSVHTPQVSNLIDSMQLALAQKQPIGLRTLLLYGPPGTGKTVTAQALANHLKMIFVAPDATRIFEDPHPSQRVIDLFDQARILAKIKHQPVLIFFDESENLFRNRDQGTSGTDAARRATLITQAFLTELQGVARHRDTNLFVVSATNKPDWLDHGIFSRFYNRLELGLPDAATLAKILEIACRVQLREDKGLTNYPLDTLSIDPDLIRSIANDAHQFQCSGRTLDQVAMRFSNALAAKVFRESQQHHQPLSQEELAAFYNAQLRAAQAAIREEGRAFFDPPPAHIAPFGMPQEEAPVDLAALNDKVNAYLLETSQARFA